MRDSGLFNSIPKGLKWVESENFGVFQVSENWVSVNKKWVEIFFLFFLGKEILVPLTDSMYVPGKLADTSTVLVDVGTGYYVEKNIEDAKDYFKRRVMFVTEQMEKIQLVGLEKSKIRAATMDVIGMKLQAVPHEEGVERA